MPRRGDAFVEPVLMEATLIGGAVVFVGTWVTSSWGVPGLIGYVVLVVSGWVWQQFR